MAEIARPRDSESESEKSFSGKSDTALLRRRPRTESSLKAPATIVAGVTASEKTPLKEQPCPPPKHRVPVICTPDPLARRDPQEMLSLQGYPALLIMDKPFKGGYMGFLLLQEKQSSQGQPHWSEELNESKRDPRWRLLKAKVISSCFGSSFQTLTQANILSGQVRLVGNEWQVVDLRRYLLSPVADLVAVADDLSELPAPTVNEVPA